MTGARIVGAVGSCRKLDPGREKCWVPWVPWVPWLLCNRSGAHAVALPCGIQRTSLVALWLVPQGEGVEYDQRVLWEIIYVSISFCIYKHPAGVGNFCATRTRN